MTYQAVASAVYTMSADDWQDMDNDSMGYCVNCNEFTTDCVEPDAQGYTCDDCEQPAVMGAQDALILGYIEIDG